MKKGSILDWVQASLSILFSYTFIEKILKDEETDFPYYLLQDSNVLKNHAFHKININSSYLQLWLQKNPLRDFASLLCESNPW